MEPITLTVRQGREGPILGRHPWIFSGALMHIPNGVESGTPVFVEDRNGRFLAQGYFNSYSQISVRLWSYDEDELVDADFFEKRVRQAYEIRRDLVESKETNSYRLIHSENDLLPGLVVNKYADYLCIQCHTRGIEAWKDEIIAALKKVLKPKGIYERSDVAVRRAEKLEDSCGVLYGKVPETIEILENGYKFLVNIKEGQKTGFFLDQREKRLGIQKYCKGKNLLNCFSYTGGFTVYALAARAKRAVSVDVSQPALDTAYENVALNGFKPKKADFLRENVKEYLPQLNPGDFDVIILDPPAFIKDRHKKEEGIHGYKKINEAALRLLPPGGILVTCSCSAHLTLPEFRYILSESAGRAGKTIQILETYTHSPDHPELVAYTEGEYLKCFIARAVG